MIEAPAARLFAPPWRLLCLRAHLLQKTRHLCAIADCRLYTSLEQELEEAIRSFGADVAVVNTATVGLGEAAAVLDILKRRSPHIVTVVCGKHPSQFPPYAADLPRADYALAGDPEPILRDLLDRLDTPQRLAKVPGLGTAEQPATEAFWLDHLRMLSLPEWDGVFWDAYRLAGTEKCRAVARLSRGHTRCPADRAFGAVHEPLRIWPMDRLAASIQKCPAQGIGEVFFDDPPGVWTPERLQQWCRALLAIQNVQPWALRMLPTHITDDSMQLLTQSLCRRIEFLFPSCDPEILRLHGCVISPPELSTTLSLLESNGISTQIRFWMGGPEEKPEEAGRVLHTIRQLGCRTYALQAFPLLLDAPICEDHSESISALMEEWLQWAVDPWTHERPSTLWGGAEQAAVLEESFAHIQRSVRRNPVRILKRLWAVLRRRNWIAFLEDRAVGLLTLPTNKGG
ncbi:MAG: B12 binding domain protein [Verrucomicrobia bacterium ADurb.Bin345]|nr:MAG: B12 binding domain protein [Verrucomicrobia bacterium ADurb.Bin345]